MNRLTKINTAVSSPLGGSNLAGAVSPAPATLSEIGAAACRRSAFGPTGEAGAPITSPPNSRSFPQKAQALPNGCIIWTGRLNPTGYGVRNGKLAHRVSYERTKGPIPEGMFVCHSCDERRCINPEHLWLGTAAANAIDMSAKGRNIQQRKTHCRQGHEYSEENTRYSVVVRRHCRACAKAAR